MSKVYTYMFVAVGLTLFMKFAGIPSGADSILDFLGIASDASNISMGQFFLGVITLFSVGVGSGIAISFFTKSPSETYIIAPIALGLFTVITSTFISVVLYTKDMGYVYYIMFLIFVPFIAAFGISIINFWRGIDS